MLTTLIITVIITLILAGVAISALTNGEGLFEKTQLAADTYEQAVQNEVIQINSLISEIDNYLKEFPQSSNTEIEYPNGEWNGKVNTPKVKGTGLIPVLLNNDGTYTELTPEQAQTTTWYDYKTQTSTTENGGTSQWANAITKNTEGQVTGYFVWIPRYEYKITYNDETDKLQGGTIDINFIQTDTTTATSGYIIHPAFTDESETTPVYANGGWKEEIPGFWVAKFAAGYAGGGHEDTNNKVNPLGAGITYTGNYLNSTYTDSAINYYGNIISGETEMKYPVFLPQTYAYNYINIGDAFNISREIYRASNYYGLNGADSHILKNSEWGAVAYLTDSKYGRNGTKVTNNNVRCYGQTSSHVYGATGYAANVPNAGTNSLVNTVMEDEVTGSGDLISYTWNTTNGMLASSTGNIHGVYDLNGCVWEYTAGYVMTQDNSKPINLYGGSFAKTSDDNIILGNTEYASVYMYSDDGSSAQANYNEPINFARRGEAIVETSINGNTNYSSWNGEHSQFYDYTYPFLCRGGYFRDMEKTGIFAFFRHTGENMGHLGFRVVLIV